LGVSYTGLGALVGLGFVGMGILSPAGGVLADRFGPRRMIALGLVFSGLAGLARAYAPSFEVFAVGSLGTGLAQALVYPNLPKVVQSGVPPKDHRIATSVYSSSLIAGPLAGVALTGSVLFEVFTGWRGALAAWAGLDLGIAALWWVVAQRHGALADPARPPDRTTGGESWHWPDIRVLLGLFLALGTAFFTVITWLPAYLQSLGYSRADAGFLTALMEVVGFGAAYGLPKVAATSRAHRWTAAIYVGFAACVGLVLLGNPLTILLAIMGFGITIEGLFAYLLLVQLGFAGTRAGTLGGLLFTMSYVGAVVGPWAFGILRDSTGGFAAGFGALALMGLLAAALGLRLPQAAKRVSPAVA
ncbi:MAG: CynX/NimT family MFS transporter, partial [Gemmatimonadales bacterium]